MCFDSRRGGGTLAARTIEPGAAAEPRFVICDNEFTLHLAINIVYVSEALKYGSIGQSDRIANRAGSYSCRIKIAAIP